MSTLKHLLPLLACLALPSASLAQAPTLSKSVTLDGTDSTGTSSSTQHYRTYYGTRSRTKSVSRELSIMVRNMSASPGEFEVEWFFVGKSAAGSKRFLYDKGSRPVVLKPGAFEKFEVESKELSNYHYRSGYSGYHYRSGDKPDGWILRAKVGDEVVRVKASSPQLEQLERDKDQFDKFVAAMRK